MAYEPAAGMRFEFIATGRPGVLRALADDGHWKVILDELDDVTEFGLDDSADY